MAEHGKLSGNAKQYCGNPVRHYVPRRGSGVSLERTLLRSAGLECQIHFAADEPAILDYNGPRVNITHESGATADVDLVGVVDVALQRTKYVNLLGLDAGAPFS